MQSRPGAVLVLTLLLLVVLDCILVGMLEVARQQRRIAENRAHILQLQLVAEGLVRRSLAEWPSAADSLTERERASDGLNLRTTFEPLGRDLVLVTGTAGSVRTRAHYASSLLARPPAIPADADVTSAALVADRATLHDGAIVSAGPADSCDEKAGIAIRTVEPPALLPGATVDGAIAHADTALSAWGDAVADRTDASSAIVVATGDTVLDRSFSGVLVVRGSVSLSALAEFRGLLIVYGNVDISAGASVVGALHAGGRVTVHGTVTRSACMAEAAITAARLRVATPVPGRGWLPSF